MICPDCGSQMEDMGTYYWCDCCMNRIDIDDMGDDGFADYDSMIDNGDEICLNCTYWAVDPHGSAYGMVCLKNQYTEGPDDSCPFFTQSMHFASYGDAGQYQFNETRRYTANKLFYWKNSR